MFYPLTRSDELKFYARYFNAVEINSTFYRPCAAKTAESWAKRTPEDFEFTVKAWQQFTHKPGEWTPADVKEFKAGMLPLIEAGKLGCILFQFPASFRHTPETTNRLQSLLELFADYPKAIELRHRSWGDVLPVLQSFDEWWRHEHRNERYDYLYTPEELQPYAIRLKSIVENKDIQRAYIFFNNHPGAKAVANAVMMRAQLDIPVSQDLPQRFIELYPQAGPQQQ